MKKLFVVLAALLYSFASGAENQIPVLSYDKDLTGLVGSGEFLVKTGSDGYKCVRGGKFAAKLPYSSQCTASVFFPGGVEYIYADGSKVLYGADPKGAMVAFTCGKAPADGFQAVPQQQYEKMKAALYKPYSEKLTISTPDKTLDMAVQFSQWLLDLGYNGKFMLCEIFRWMDIWARDLGTGLLPGALATGRAEAALKSLEYDLDRYSLCSPEDLKNTNDTSKGGTAESVGWTVRSIWNYYMYSGDKALLSKHMDVMRPWVEKWVRRDYDEDGLIIDFTEHKDHMIMMLTPQGVSTLGANSTYLCMLNFSSCIEQALGNVEAAGRYARLAERTVNALNTVFWNPDKGYFNDMRQFDQVSRRSCQSTQGMLMMMDGTDAQRGAMALDFVKKNNWIECGSITVMPRMNHVDLENDQNVKVWPWWNFWEAEARFRYGDPDGGYHLLSLGASTIRDEKYPGLIEENRDVDGSTFGGNAFPTAAGNLLDVVAKDMMGVRAAKAGWSEAYVLPNVPAGWKEYACKSPVPGGHIELDVKDGHMTVRVMSEQVKTILTTAEADVEGAAKAVAVPQAKRKACYKAVPKRPMPSMPQGAKARLALPQMAVEPVQCEGDVIGLEELMKLDRSQYASLVVNGNTLPVCARAAIERFVQDGGQVIFFGATVNPRSEVAGAGLMCENCGIVDWIDLLPARKKVYIDGWEHTSRRKGDATDYVYRSSCVIPSDFANHEVFIEVGPLTGLDSVFVNKQFVACYNDTERYHLQQYPASTDYPKSKYDNINISRIYPVPATVLKMGEANHVEVRIYKDKQNVGFTEKNSPNFSIVTDDECWQYVDEDIRGFGFDKAKRKGVNYWGTEQFFNCWSTRQGLFGLRKAGRGVDFVPDGPLGGIPSKDIEVSAAYTDFSVFYPMNFDVLAYTTTSEHLLYPMEQEHYPCAVRISHNDKGGGYILVAPELTQGSLGRLIMKRL